jgi:virulence factor Mce-like protein
VVVGSLALSGCSVYDIPLPGGANVGSDPLTLHLQFRDVLDLVPQSTVKVDDVTVGKVTDIKLNGYIADVTVQVPRTMRIPVNEQAIIDQTSLLGEKFVNLKRPAEPSAQMLQDNATIPLSQTGRNPEVEEVFSALAALLNGGGVAQIKKIATELNTAVGGREQDVRAVLDQIHTFMGVLNANRSQIVGALDHVDNLAKSLRQQDGTIKQTLADLPGALRSVNTQRADLRRLLGALSKLSNVGVRVIRASKQSTIDSLTELAPVLTAFANAGQDLPKSLQVLLTFPFVDAAVGSSPQVARNLHIGDYVNLSANLDLDLNTLSKGLGLPPTTLGGISTIVCGNLPDKAKQALCQGLQQVLGSICAIPGVSGSPLCNDGTATGAVAGGNRKAAALPGGTTLDPAAEANAVNEVKNLLDNIFAALSGSSATTPGLTGLGGSPGATPSPGTRGPVDLGQLLSGLGLGRPAPGYDKQQVDEAMTRLRGLAGAGRLLLQGVYS